MGEIWTGQVARSKLGEGCGAPIFLKLEVFEQQVVQLSAHQDVEFREAIEEAGGRRKIPALRRPVEREGGELGSPPVT